MKKITITYLMTALYCISITLMPNIGISAQQDFKATSLNAEDKKYLWPIFKNLEAKWVSSEELAKYPGLYWQDELQKQSFRIISSQPGLEDAYFVPVQADYDLTFKDKKDWAQCLSLLIINHKDSKILALPKHPVMQWNFDHIESVAFRDVQGQGKRSIIVNASGMTGMGNAEPFNVIAVYLPNTDGSWYLDDNLQKLIHTEMYEKCKKDSCRSIKALTGVAETFFKNKK